MAPTPECSRAGYDLQTCKFRPPSYHRDVFCSSAGRRLNKCKPGRGKDHRIISPASSRDGYPYGVLVPHGGGYVGGGVYYCPQRYPCGKDKTCYPKRPISDEESEEDDQYDTPGESEEEESEEEDQYDTPEEFEEEEDDEDDRDDGDDEDKEEEKPPPPIPSGPYPPPSAPYPPDYYNDPAPSPPSSNYTPPYYPPPSAPYPPDYYNDPAPAPPVQPIIQPPRQIETGPPPPDYYNDVPSRYTQPRDPQPYQYNDFRPRDPPPIPPRIEAAPPTPPDNYGGFTPAPPPPFYNDPAPAPPPPLPTAQQNQPMDIDQIPLLREAQTAVIAEYLGVINEFPVYADGEGGYYAMDLEGVPVNVHADGTSERMLPSEGEDNFQVPSTIYDDEDDEQGYPYKGTIIDFKNGYPVYADGYGGYIERFKHSIYIHTDKTGGTRYIFGKDVFNTKLISYIGNFDGSSVFSDGSGGGFGFRSDAPRGTIVGKYGNFPIYADGDGGIFIITSKLRGVHIRVDGESIMYLRPSRYDPPTYRMGVDTTSIPDGFFAEYFVEGTEEAWRLISDPARVEPTPTTNILQIAADDSGGSEPRSTGVWVLVNAPAGIPPDYDPDPYGRDYDARNYGWVFINKPRGIAANYDPDEFGVHRIKRFFPRKAKLPPKKPSPVAGKRPRVVILPSGKRRKVS